MVGRTAELSQLRDVWTGARHGRPGAVVVAGEAGVGKSRLLTEFAGEVHAAGGVAITGGCLDVGDAVLAFAPIVEALRELTAVLDEAELNRVLGGARTELARLVPDFGEPPARAEPVAPGRMFELLLGVLHGIADRRPLLLTVEDLHWADRSTRDLLGFLVRNLRGGIVLALTYRSDEMHRRHPLRPFLAEMERGGRVLRLDLDRLGRPELAAQISQIRGEQAPAALVNEIMTRSEGNPFYAEELLMAHGEDGQLPATILGLVMTRVQALSEPAQQMLETAAIAGRRVDHDLLAEVAGLALDRLVPLLREAVGHQILVATAGNGGTESYEFRHALVQEAVYDDLLAVQRSRLHAAYARAMDRRLDARAGAVGRDRVSAVELGELAYHWYAAHELEPAFLAYIRAAAAAEASSGLAEAQRHYERAVELWDRVPDAGSLSPLDRATLLRRAAEAAYLVFDTDQAIALADLALAEIDPADRQLAATVLERKARYLWAAANTGPAMATLERAVAMIPREPSPQRARVLAAHGQMLLLAGRVTEAAQRCEEGIAVAQMVGARAEEGHALNSLGAARAMLGHPQEGAADLERAVHIASQLGDPDDLIRGYVNLAFARYQSGRYAKAAAAAMAGYEAAARYGMVRGYGAVGLASAAESHLMLGDWGDTEELLTRLFDLDLPPRTRQNGLRVRAHWRTWRGDLAAAQADLAEAEAISTETDPQLGAPVRAVTAEALVWSGDPVAARTAAMEGLAMLARAGAFQPAMVVRLCRAGLAAEAAIGLRARAAGDEQGVADTLERAGRLLDRALSAVDEPGVAPSPPAAAMLAGAVAHHSRLTTGAPATWAAAIEAWQQLANPFEVAHAGWYHAEALLAAGDREAATDQARTAWRQATGLGARRLAEELESLARRGRVDLAQEQEETQPAPEPAADPFARLGLTARERDVLLLVADGRTNRQIAAELYISDKTASVHVSRILGKLQVANRAEAAAAAHRLGLVGPQREASGTDSARG
jgi:DNA-binding CsgD family transcriptional regulator/tetratricopeptide (TPR) repeat protein